jgi:hypothetical protein
MDEAQRGPQGELADDDDDVPLDEAEAAVGEAAAGEAVDESLDDRVETVLRELGGVTRRRDGDVVLLTARGRVFAVLGPGLFEVALDAPIAAAALRTPDTRPSRRGAGWIAFTPALADRFALDRAEAWLRLGHRRASA